MMPKQLIGNRNYYGIAQDVWQRFAQEMKNIFRARKKFSIKPVL